MKDDVSGIGTVTFVDGTNFMALGDSVSDIDTGVMMRCSTRWSVHNGYYKYKQVILLGTGKTSGKHRI